MSPRRVRVPPEHVSVEAHRRVVVAGVQLEPAGRAGLGEEPKPLVQAGLPRCRSPRRPTSATIAILPSSITSMAGTITHRRARPRRRRSSRRRRSRGRCDQTSGMPETVVRHAAGDGDAVLVEVDVAAVVGAGIVGGPTEQLAVERPARRPDRTSTDRPNTGRRWGLRHASAQGLLCSIYEHRRHSDGPITRNSSRPAPTCVNRRRIAPSADAGWVLRGR